ncbi:MAG: catalase [Propionibacteriaceae bacterium]|jgi:catalase|nr:catalase [Propionibacteriaceae bacterium]MDX6323344.1 catalase [Propionibacteriaceae bacterium]
MSSEPVIPGAPAPEPPPLAEPVEPREPAPPKPSQRGPEQVSPTGVPTGAPVTSRSQSTAFLTTSQGLRLPDSDHSLKAGPRGPVLLRDHHLREKITHFDHERIPERVVHARGAGAHGVFRSYGTAANLTKAGFLAADVETPVFVRFSTVLGSRGSADTVRDTRGFATKFYTDEGTFDLVGNNIPVFFIQDGIKFPDVVHAAKPHPDKEIPQAQSAHDTFWDFVSLHTEAQHHTMWNMSDRGIPRSYRTMEGFGVHTFRLVAADGSTSLVKWHWKPKAGVHSLVWEEAQLISGTDPDFHRRDLADAIEAGAFPQWELGLQVVEDNEEQMFEGIDLLDPTKIIPEELAPVQPIGIMTLNANPINYFAETEQIAFHPGNLVPGIDVTDDPLLAGRLFSYIDTQITRLGGPNFGQLPINRPHAPVNDMLRDGMHQTAVHSGVAPYKPNSLDGGCPFFAGADLDGYVEVAQTVAQSTKLRAAPASFDDHTSQPRMFFASLTPVEQQHLIDAYTFELAKCYEQPIKERQLLCLAQIDSSLAAAVAAGLGLPAPASPSDLPEVQPSPALSQVGKEWPVTGRNIGVLVGPGSDLAQVRATIAAIDAQGMLPLVIADTGGKLGQGTANEVTVQRTLLSTRSVEFDAIVVADGRQPSPKSVLLVNEAYRHAKALAAWGTGAEVLGAAGCPPEAPGVVLAAGPGEAVEGLVPLLSKHRVWERPTPSD